MYLTGMSFVGDDKRCRAIDMKEDRKLYVSSMTPSLHVQRYLLPEKSNNSLCFTKKYSELNHVVGHLLVSWSKHLMRIESIWKWDWRVLVLSFYSWTSRCIVQTRTSRDSQRTRRLCCECQQAPQPHS